MKRLWLLPGCITAIVLLVLASVSAAETIRYNGSSILLVTVIKPLAQAFSEKTGVEFDLKGKSTSYGLEKLLAGECDICGAGTTKIDTFQEKAGGTLKIYNFAQEGVAIGVNAFNQVEDLSMTQLADIMTGRTTDWADLGWAKGKKIVPVSCAKGTAHYKNFSKKVLKGAPFKEGTLFVNVNPLMPKEIAKYPGAIGYSGLSILDGKKGVKVISLEGVKPSQESLDNGSYPVTKKYYLITKGEPAGKLKEFVDFCQGPEGQEIIVKGGLLKLAR